MIRMRLVQEIALICRAALPTCRVLLRIYSRGVCLSELSWEPSETIPVTVQLFFHFCTSKCEVKALILCKFCCV